MDTGLLRRKDFRRLHADLSEGSIGVTDERLKSSPADVFAFAKASVRGLQYARQNRTDAMKILSDYFHIRDQALSEQLFDLYLSRLPADGSADEAWMKGAIAFTQKSIGGASKDIRPGQVFDFSFVHQAPR